MMPLRVSRRAVLAASLMAVPAGALRAIAADAAFAVFLSSVRRDAIAQGVRAATVDLALRQTEYLPHVIELDRAQPEHTMTFAGFLEKVVTPQKTADGRAALTENWPLLVRVHQRFNVQPRFIVALWAVESNFGKVMGNYKVFSSLATLA